MKNSDAEMPLEVAVLGPVRARLGDQDVALGSAQQRAVFAMLAISAGAVVTQQEIIDGLWEHEVPASAKGMVHTHISALRRALDPGRERGRSSLLCSEGAGYLLRLDREALDVTRFESAARLARRQLAAAQAESAVSTTTEALSLWCGTPLAGLSGPFAAARRRHLEATRSVLLEQRAEALVALERWDQAVSELTPLTGKDSFRDKPRELLMTALHRSGRTGEALEVYRDTRAVYAAELGVEPGPVLRKLHEKILAGDRRSTRPERPVAPLAPQPEPPKTRGGAESAVVGRERELKALRAAASDVAAGHGRAVWIEGAPGIGKSALVGLTLDFGRTASCEIVSGVANEFGQQFPLRLTLDALTSAGAQAGGTLASQARLRAVSSLVDNGFPVINAIDEIVSLLEEACARTPVVFALDDLQRADEASLAVWDRLCALTTRLPLLVIGAAQDLPHNAEMAHLRHRVRAAGGTVIDLTPLPGSAVHRLVRDLVGAPPGPKLREVAARAEGNPLHVREIVEALMRDQAVFIGRTAAELTAGALDRAPDSLMGAIADRLSFLTGSQREVLRWAAVLGGEFTVADLATVSGKPVSKLVAPIDEAFTTGVLRAAGSRLAFVHPLLRQALYEGMPLGLRVALHQQAAETLAEAGAPIRLVAMQLLAAGEPSAWLVNWLADTAPALAAQAPKVATELLERALTAVGTAESRKATLLVHLSNLLCHAGNEVAAERHARDALRLLTDPHDAAQMRRILSDLADQPGRLEETGDTPSIDSDDPELPDEWRERLSSLLSLVGKLGPDLNQGRASRLRTDGVDADSDQPLLRGLKGKNSPPVHTVNVADGTKRHPGSAMLLRSSNCADRDAGRDEAPPGTRSVRSRPALRPPRECDSDLSSSSRRPRCSKSSKESSCD